MRDRRLLCLLFVLVLAAGACSTGDDSGDAPVDEPETDAPAADEPRPGEPDTVEAVRSDAWTSLTDAPVELTEIDAEPYDGRLWTVGGIAGDAEVTTLVQIYDPSTDSWEDGPSLPEPVHHASLVATATQLMVVGGFRSLAFDPIDDVYILDDEQARWVEGPRLPAPRGAGGAAWDGDRVVFGGGVGEDGLADEVWAIDDIEAGEWQQVGRLSVARDHLDATSDGDGRVWFLAGRLASLQQNQAVVDLLVGGTLTPIGELSTGRGGVAAFYTQAHGACLAGGEAPDGTFAEVECIDEEGVTTTLPPLGQARHGLGAGVIDDVVFVVLGGPEPLLSVSGATEALRVDRSA
jgi:hypothetical protein